MNLYSKIKKRFYEFSRKKIAQKRNAFVEDYITKNNLDDLVDRIKDYSKTTGAGLYDYVALHSYIRKQKPLFILECGTGRSTWILADALQKNHKEFGIQGKIISMESVEHWYNESLKKLPARYKDYVEIHYSKASTYMYSFIKGTVYENIPDHEYNLIFIDGPELNITENETTHETVNMDLIRYLLKSNKSITAIIDCRMRTSIAYGNIFGKNKIDFLNKPWLLGILKDVSAKDLLLHQNGATLLKLLQQSTHHNNAEPFWLQNEL